MWIDTGNNLAKLHGNILSLSENTAKNFRGCYFFDSHCICLTFCFAFDKQQIENSDKRKQHWSIIVIFLYRM